ncbi:MAG: hypothetical protein P8N51_01820, partial [Pseudomonadales bacterium]|nr:hypothetical protein [Pseudomonadales bacterium]
MLGIYSLYLDQQMDSTARSGLFLPYWHYFLMGVPVCNVIRGKKAASTILSLWVAAEVAALLVGDIKSYSVAGVVFCLMLFSLWKMNNLDSFLSGRVFHYFGTISYTLYLVHPDIGWKTISVARQFFGSDMSSIQTLFVFILAITLSVMTAHAFHVTFEKPSFTTTARINCLFATPVWANGNTQTSIDRSRLSHA